MISAKFVSLSNDYEYETYSVDEDMTNCVMPFVVKRFWSRFYFPACSSLA